MRFENFFGGGGGEDFDLEIFIGQHDEIPSRAENRGRGGHHPCHLRCLSLFHLFTYGSIYFRITCRGKQFYLLTQAGVMAAIKLMWA